MSNYGDYRDVEVLRKRGSELEAELARCEAEYHAQADRAEKAERERDEARAEALRLLRQRWMRCAMQDSGRARMVKGAKDGLL